MELNASNLSNTIDRSLITYYSEQGTVSKGTLDDEPDGFYVYSLPSQDLYTIPMTAFRSKSIRD